MAQESSTSNAHPTYELSCTDCEFEATVDGSVYDALDVADAHQHERGDPTADHFVNFERKIDD